VPLPEFNESGDLPVGVHRASLVETVQLFGKGSKQREAVTGRLERVNRLASATGFLDRFIVFGSFVSTKVEPNDVDVILVMRNDFRLEDCPAGSDALFDHARAQAELGASIFWVRPEMLLGETIDQFLTHWQRKRDGTQRGIVEITE
jgi:hypothetical protein